MLRRNWPVTQNRLHSGRLPAPRRAPLEPSSSYRVLVVDDEASLRTRYQKNLERSGHQDVLVAEDGATCIELVEQHSLDLILLDNQLPDVNGVDLIPQIREIAPDVSIVLVTGSIDPGVLDDALLVGADTFYRKTNISDQASLSACVETYGRATHLRKTVGTLTERNRELEQENREYRRQLREQVQDEKFDRIKGKSGVLLDMLEKVAKVADTDGTVLITGESGTGKELVAQTIHYKSARSKHPLVTVNCGAIPEELLESELFGHVKGAFTSAVSSRKGRFEAAEGGTIFLDEIGDMSPTLQVKLLRVLQEKTFEPVGSSRTQVADVRVIAATHQNLEQLITEKRFREDLFYRLNVLPITVPPLRARKPPAGLAGEQASNDILNLADHFLAKWNAQRPGRDLEFSTEALAKLEAYEWPGNIRQLENCIERMVVMGPYEGGELGVDLLPTEIAQANPTSPGIGLRVGEEGLKFNEVVDQVETDLILQALELTDWNKNQAAARLGLNRTTLLEKIKKKGLRPPEG